ncbi:MAG: YdcF family protein [Gammaproteobacteria bacterium]|nr:YdcF family protein [Gammaproteobacteria bacterium]
MMERRIHFIRKRHIWVPTWPTTLIVLVMVILVLRWIVLGLYPLLAHNHPIENARNLVVEGWVHDQALQTVAKVLFPSGEFDRIYTTGGPIARGKPLSRHKTVAQLAAAILRELGVPDSVVVIAPAAATLKNRTWESARGLHQKLEHEFPEFVGVSSFNIVSQGAHSRRTLMVYRKVFDGSSVKIGIISLTPDTYDPDRWWSSSDGLKTVVTETLATIYEAVADSGR